MAKLLRRNGNIIGTGRSCRFNRYYTLAAVLGGRVVYRQYRFESVQDAIRWLSWSRVYDVERVFPHELLWDDDGGDV